MKLLKFLFICLSLITACNPDKKIDTKAVNQYIENSKIKRISVGEIMAAAEMKGSLITDSIQKAISDNLNTALLKGGVKNGLPYCILSNNPIKDSLEKKHHALISRSSFSDKLKNPENAPVDIQNTILDAYSFNLEKGIPLVKDVQVQEKSIIYNAPIQISENLCLKCHGEIGKDLTKEDYETILSAYPKDRSINLKMNEFIGLWTVKFSKKEFIQEIK